MKKETSRPRMLCDSSDFPNVFEGSCGMVRARLAWREPMMSTPEREQFSAIERIERSLLLLAYFIELDGDVHVPMYQEFEAEDLFDQLFGLRR
jgi:hypothetical protein